MNCIFVCIFNQEQYVRMFYLLLESICIYGNLDSNTDILIYTSTPFMNMIKQSHLFNKHIKFEINDSYTSIESACRARLDLFYLPSIVNYNKILYLDTDIIIKGDLNLVFDIAKEDILYVLQEGSIDNDTDYYGKSLFGDEINNYEDKTAFTSGIMLFNHCEKIKELFDNINTDMKNRSHSFYDQPFIVYNAFKYNLYDNKVLKSCAVNNDYSQQINMTSNLIIHHFPGGPGHYKPKIEKMAEFLKELKDITISDNIARAKEFINTHLIPIIHGCGELLEGNIFMFHQTTNYADVFLPKAKNISSLVLNKNITKVAEIGFNSGFSTLLMLLSNPRLKITCFDLGDHKYTLPCYEKLKETFGDRINIIIGDSTKTLRQVNDTYELIHIDGGHATEIAESDIIQSYRLSKKRTILIMDDYDFSNLHWLWDRYIYIYSLKPIDISLYQCTQHDIRVVS